MDDWENTAPTPESGASTSTMNCRKGSGSINTGAEVNNSFSLEKADSALGVHTKGEEVEVSLVRGPATKLTFLMKRC